MGKCQLKKQCKKVRGLAMDKQYVLEWSKSSNGFHIQKLGHLLKSNERSFSNNASHDYLLLMIGTKDECCESADKLRGITINRVVPC